MALINYITQIQFEFGAIRLLRQECERVGIRRPLIVTDRKETSFVVDARITLTPASSK